MSDLKKLRVTRRNAKAALTRIGTSIIYAIDNRRPIEELRVAVKRLETAFAEVVDKHEKLTECIEEEEIFEKEEKWLNEVQRDFLELETKAKDYVIEGQTVHEEEKTVAQGSSVQVDDSVEELNEETQNGNEQLHKVKCEQLLHNFDNKQFSCKYKFDKPKMPVFFGDVRDYGTFKSDFKHSIESGYSKEIPYHFYAIVSRVNHWTLLKSQKSLRGKLNQEFGSLSAYVDTEGVVRVGGRIKKSTDISYDMKNPVLIPYEAPISKMIVGFYHGLAHSGVASTVAKVRAKYWIIRAHRIAKSTKFNCVICRREARTESQFMADLPKERDVFPALVPRSKWKIEKRNVRVGDIVVVQDINVVRGKWRIGRIVEVFPGSDGRIRNVRIRSEGITLQRPITKFVVILPFEEAGGLNKIIQFLATYWTSFKYFADATVNLCSTSPI
ncbi:hypothetical protein GQR58_007256 [Nymphon striatum]|nr:hypothetical protein GQR58_007256 [Nymphon striatum]